MKKDVSFVIKLSEQLVDFSNLQAGQTLEWQILRTGSWNHEVYGHIEITDKVLSDMIYNFENNVVWTQIVVDEEHDIDKKALAIYKRLYLKYIDGETQLWATVQLTQRWVNILKDWSYLYFSPEFKFVYQDKQTGQIYENVLTGGGVTNKPFIKRMASIQASENSQQKDKNMFYISLYGMDEMQTLLQKAEWQKTLSFSEKSQIIMKFSELSDEEKEVVKTEVEQVVEKPAVETETKTTTDENWNTTTETKQLENPTTVTTTTKEVVETTPTTETISASEKALSKRVLELENQLKLSETEKSFDSMVFSDKNEKWVFVPGQKTDFVKFVSTLTNEQTKMFSELVNWIDKNAFMMFSETGTSNVASSNLTARFNDVVSEYSKTFQCSEMIARKNVANKEFLTSKGFTLKECEDLLG